MVFNSYIFLLAFLPITAMICNIACNKFENRNIFCFLLLISSLIFYCYSGMEGLPVLFLHILINYFLSMRIQRKQNGEKSSRIILGIGILVNLLVLFYYKYLNFFIDSLNLVFDTDFRMHKLLVPLGISFLTFQQIAFLIDSYKGEAPHCSFFEYAAFISFFPHISSGPIILHGDFFPALMRTKNKIDWDFFASGLYLFIMGLGKKVLIADTFARAVDWGYGNLAELNSTSALFVSIAYSLQIYFDFSGYSDMAIGISRILRLDLPVNFNSPYKAKTILEFWDRWHITLTRFFTRYLYIPMGGNRKGSSRTYIHIFIVFFLSGLWHGASWTFILWGLLHGAFMVFTRRFKVKIEKLPGIVNQTITLLFVNFTWILFRSGSLSTFRQMIGTILQNNWGKLNENICNIFVPSVTKAITGINIPVLLWPITALVLVLAVTLRGKNLQESVATLRYTLPTMLLMVGVAIACVFSFSQMSTFIYVLF